MLLFSPTEHVHVNGMLNKLLAVFVIITFIIIINFIIIIVIIIVITMQT